MQPEVSCFRRSNFSPRTTGVFSTSTERGEQVKYQAPNTQRRRRPCSLLLAPCSTLITPHALLLPLCSSVVRRCLLRGLALSAPLPPRPFVALRRTRLPTRVRPPGDAFSIGRRCRRGDRPSDPASDGEWRRSVGGSCPRALLSNNTKAGAVVFRISFSPRNHRPRCLPSFSPFCLATCLSQPSLSAIARKPIHGALRIVLPEICGRTPSPSCPVGLTPKDGGGFGPILKFVASRAAHTSA